MCFRQPEDEVAVNHQPELVAVFGELPRPLDRRTLFDVFQRSSVLSQWKRFPMVTLKIENVEPSWAMSLIKGERAIS